MRQRMVGRYRLEAKIAEGSAAEVFRATDTACGGTVALKLLPEQSRFRKEIRAAAMLRHRNIVSVYEAGKDADHSYLVMEYVGGRTLADTIAARRLSTKKVFSFAMQIAEGLAAAHSAGVIHRDLKPANIMITSDGTVKLLDFGLAKLMRTSETLDSTQPGTVLGSVSYMSPEQAQGLPVSPATDVFSFGTVLYEMICGRKAFDGASYVAILSAIVHGPSPKLPDSPFSCVVASCLEKDPSARYASGVQLLEAVKQCRPASWSLGTMLRKWL